MKQHWCLLCMATVLFGIVSCSGDKQGKGANTVRVKTETVKMSTEANSAAYVGQVEEQSATAVSFTSMGTLQRVLVSEGQWVKRGQTLATLDATSAQSALASAKAQLDQAHDALERMRLLHDNGSLAEMKWVEVQSQVQQAEAQYKLLEKQVKDCQLTAPVNGVIGSGVMAVGETALPSAPVCRILNIDRVRIRVAIPEQEIGQAKSSADIVVAALGDVRFHSNSITKGVEGDLMTHTYTIYVNVDNPRHQLLPGMVANVTFPQNDATPRMMLPARSVGQSPDGSQFVWVVKDGKAHQQPVTVGDMTGNNLVITEGLKEGDVVITEGYQKVSEGTEVKN